MVVNLDCRPEKVHRDLIVLEFGESKAQRSVLYRYRDLLTDTKNGNAALFAKSQVGTDKWERMLGFR